MVIPVNSSEISLINEEETISRWAVGRENTIRFLGRLYLAATLIAGSAALDSSTGELMWANDDAKVLLLSETYSDVTDHATIIFPGWGIKDGRRIAEALNPALSQIGPVFYASYPNKGFGEDNKVFEKIAENITRSMNERGKTELVVDTQSMGSALFFKVLPFLSDRINVNTLVLDCSPMSINDLRDKRAIEAVRPLRHAQLGLLSAVAGTIAHVIHKSDSSSGLVHSIKEGVRIGVTGTDPTLMKEQLTLFMDFQPDPLLLEKLQNTRIIMMMPDHPDNDVVVNVSEAKIGWERYFGRQIEIVHVRNGEHASPTTRSGEYVEAIFSSSIFSLFFNNSEHAPYQADTTRNNIV